MSNQLKWDLPHLHTHLQDAVALEFWTIAYYLSVLYSIKDPSSLPYQLIQSVVYQEMFHVELAANVANAYGLSPSFEAPMYQGENIPHLNFALDHPNPTAQYSPYTAELGPLDEVHVNTMCLIEYPEWKTTGKPDLREDTTQYGSISELYDAIEFGASELITHIQPNYNQVNFFQRFYQNCPETTVTKTGGEGMNQVLALLAAIVDQGEGKTTGDREIALEFQNTADDAYPSWSHYTKFIAVRNAKNWPEIYEGVACPEAGSPGAQAQEILIRNFTAFRQSLECLFQGCPSPEFGTNMATLGGNVLNCWKKGAIPKFSR